MRRLVKEWWRLRQNGTNRMYNDVGSIADFTLKEGFVDKRFWLLAFLPYGELQW